LSIALCVGSSSVQIVLENKLLGLRVLLSRILKKKKKSTQRRSRDRYYLLVWPAADHKIKWLKWTGRTENKILRLAERRRTNLPYDISVLELEDKKHNASQYHKALQHREGAPYSSSVTYARPKRNKIGLLYKTLGSVCCLCL